MPSLPENSTVDRMTATLSGKPVSCAAMNFSMALSSEESTMDATLNASPSIMMRVRRTVSAMPSASKRKISVTIGRAKAYMIAAITSDASMNRFSALLAKRLECFRLYFSRSSTNSGTTVAVMQELNSSTGK